MFLNVFSSVLILGAISNSSSASSEVHIKFTDHLTSEKRTCAGEGMIGSPIRSLTMAQCYKKCKNDDRCLYFFFTEQCVSGQFCSKPITSDNSGKPVCKSEKKLNQPTGCCALFNKCKRSGHVNNRGHTCMKGMYYCQ